MTSLSKKQKEALNTVVQKFPEFPLATLKPEAINNLLFKIYRYKDKKSVHHMQQQSWLSNVLANQID